MFWSQTRSPRFCRYATLPETRSTVAAMRLTEGAKAWMDLLKDKNQRALLAGMLTLHLNYASLTTLLPLYAAHAFGADAGQIGLLFSVRPGRASGTAPRRTRLQTGARSVFAGRKYLRIDVDMDLSVLLSDA